MGRLFKKASYLRTAIESSWVSLGGTENNSWRGPPKIWSSQKSLDKKIARKTKSRVVEGSLLRRCKWSVKDRTWLRKIQRNFDETFKNLTPKNHWKTAKRIRGCRLGRIRG